MTIHKELSRNAREVRLRLLNPPNAVPDLGIDLKRKTPQPPAPGRLVQEYHPPKPVYKPLPSHPPIVLIHRLNARRIVELVSRHSGYSVDDLLGPHRRVALVFIRHIAIWLCSKHLPHRSLMYLASIFRRDHTSILHGRNRIRRYIEGMSPEGERIKELVRRVEGDIHDRHRSSLSGISQPDMAIRS